MYDVECREMDWKFVQTMRQNKHFIISTAGAPRAVHYQLARRNQGGVRWASASWDDAL